MGAKYRFTIKEQKAHERFRQKQTAATKPKKTGEAQVTPKAKKV